MSLLHIISAALTPTIDAISLSAPWADISIASPTSAAANANITCTFTLSSPRTLMLNYFGIGTIYYRKDSGTYTAIANGGTFTVTSGQTVNFEYDNNVDINESRDVTITDNTRGSQLDVFVVTATGFGHTGSGGGGIEP